MRSTLGKAREGRPAGVWSNRAGEGPSTPAGIALAAADSCGLRLGRPCFRGQAPPGGWVLSGVRGGGGAGDGIGDAAQQRPDGRRRRVAQNGLVQAGAKAPQGWPVAAGQCDHGCVLALAARIRSASSTGNRPPAAPVASPRSGTVIVAPRCTGPGTHLHQFGDARCVTQRADPDQAGQACLVPPWALARGRHH